MTGSVLVNLKHGNTKIEYDNNWFTSLTHICVYNEKLRKKIIFAQIQIHENSFLPIK